jgi:hypothetical protein
LGASHERDCEPSGFRDVLRRVGLGVHAVASVDHSADTETLSWLAAVRAMRMAGVEPEGSMVTVRKSAGVALRGFDPRAYSASSVRPSPSESVAGSLSWWKASHEASVVPS